MITIYYYYWSKSESTMKPAQKNFYDVKSAIRFCWSMKNRKMLLDGWSCYDPDDNLYMTKKVNLTIINGW